LKIKVLKNVMLKNDALGADNRWEFKKKNIFVLNMTSSPGAGKTTLLENSLQHLTKKYNVAVIEGDLYTSKDAERLEKFNIPIIQINTEGGCHLDAKMINAALKTLDLDKLDVLIIENVGNLVCPASFDLGANKMALLYSLTEGDDKPTKYATMFSIADIVVINKVDIAPYLNVNVDSAIVEVKKVNSKCDIIALSATKPETLNEWNQWIESEIESILKD
jgi:hydrogenase nickel incorporation protein HypB